MSMSRYLDLFLSESREHLAAIERDIAVLERSPDDAPALQELFRHAHSIKGMAASMGYPEVADLAHAVEEALDGVKRGEGPFDEAMKSAVLLAFDGIDRMIGAIASSGEPAVDTAPMYAALGRLERSASRGATDPGRGWTGREGPADSEAGAPPARPLLGALPRGAAPGGMEGGAGSQAGFPGDPEEARLIAFSIRFEADSTLPSARAAVAVKRLEAQGRLVRCSPSLEQLARRKFDGLLQVLLLTRVAPERLAEEIRRLTDVRSVETAPADGALLEGAEPGGAGGTDGGPCESGSPQAAPGGASAIEGQPFGAAGPRVEQADPRGSPAPETPPRAERPLPPGNAPRHAPDRSPGGPKNGAPAGESRRKGPGDEQPAPVAEAASRPSPPEPRASREGLPPAADAAPLSTVRVPARSLDAFLDTIGELIVHRGRLDALMEPGHGRAVRVALDRLKGLTDRLFGDVMTLRMLPFDSISHRFARSVRELADRQSKKVSLRVSGGEVLLDRSVLDELTDPINHLLRNAVDHGIEPPAARLLAGKPEAGSIAISLERTGDTVTLKIEDDGRGMDPGRIREAAVRKGFASREGLKKLEDQEILMLTTIPGFSTADRVTDVSGRGVGLDVVRTRVETLGGRLRLQSRRGEGLTVSMRLPLTIVVVKAFLVEAGLRRWAVPLGAVRRTVELGEGRVVTRGGRDYVLIEGEDAAMPLFDLAATLGLPSGAGSGLGSEALIASDREPPVAFAVDKVVGRREIVVKPLRSPLEELRGFSGATILEDGSISLILDLANLVPL